MGSSLFNLLTLAILDLCFYSRGGMLSRRGAAHALSGTFSASMAAIAAIGLLTAKFTAPYAVLGVSFASIVLLFTYIFGVRLVYLDQQVAMKQMRHGSLRARHRLALLGPVGPDDQA